MWEKTEGSFVETGFNNWRKALERFKYHADSDLHKETIFTMEMLREGVHVLLAKQIKSEQVTC